MLDCVVQGFDALQVALIDFVLSPGPMRLGCAEEAPQQAHWPFHDIEMRDIQRYALIEKFETQFLVHQGEENETGMFADVIHSA
jgi:hypothetical protein